MTSESHDVQLAELPTWRRVVILLASAWLAGILGVGLVILGFNVTMDRLVDFFLLDRISNGELRLAGISAPLSEEPARLLGILVSVTGMAWWMRREGLHPDSSRLGGRVPWPWIFGMNAGLTFAILETLLNGDVLLAIVPRAMAHGTYASLILLALSWRRQYGATWPVVAAVALAMVLHGVRNGLGAVGQEMTSAAVTSYGYFLVLVAAVLAAWYLPTAFGTWTFDIRRPRAAEV